jgi:tetratricopeptide (TPR) repeat protein
VWMEQDAPAARAVLQRLGPTSEARLAAARTDREEGFLRAVEILYGDGEKKTRDRAYADAMIELHHKYPEDVEATSFAALALLGTSHDGRDLATYMRAAALLEPLFPTHPKHPGIAHYLIHSYDDPVHAPLGLRPARNYSTIAPSAAHAQHMCSHIFVAMGMWDDVVKANEAAVRITGVLRAASPSPLACGHYPFWLTYGYLQQGRIDAAKEIVKRCYQGISTATQPNWGGFLGIRSRYLLDTEDWSGDVAALAASPSQPAAVFTHEFTNAFSAIRRGDLAAARASLARMNTTRQAIEESAAKPSDPAHAGMPGMSARPVDPAALGRLRILCDEIVALIRDKEGATGEAIKLLQAAAAFEETLPFEFGPPSIDKPAYELLGELLLAANRPTDARAAFEKALARTPERTAALAGLMKAAGASGDARKAAELKARLQAIWQGADRKVQDALR